MPQTQTAPAVSEIDVRSLVPAQRHAKIFELVGQLAPGGSFVLVNDHDPKPLYYQLEAEHPQQFSWTYLEQGPQVWRVEIGRLLKAA
ncbi:Hemerythrin [Hyphomicrobiales bacterium]|nr:Hemerythrin [Hyphomicrobiales bacterium]CAH1696218.1 Hemerythrin [Hyphomicrobiales bacterium]